MSVDPTMLNGMTLSIAGTVFQGKQGNPGTNGINGTDGTNGENGKSAEIRRTSTHIQWRYEGDSSWIDLVPISELKGLPGNNGLDGLAGKDGAKGNDGLDGRKLEIQKSDTHLQYRYEGDDQWTNLVALIELVGPKGNDGANGINGTDGADGANGADGINGSDGVDGTDGINGADGADGREIELSKSATHIQWRYVGESSWIDVVALADLKGNKGDQGQSFVPNATEESANLSNYDSEAPGFAFLAIDEGMIYFRLDPTGWSDGMPFGKGEPGEQGDPGNPGSAGREVEFFKSSTHIQWRYTGTSTWTDLIAISDLKGDKGDKGDDGDDGAPGPDGADGKEIQIQKTATHIQWRYSGDAAWSNLIALEELIGPAGNDGADGIQGIQGIQGIPGVKGDPGTNGTNGIDGIDGTNGIDGADGRGIVSAIAEYQSSDSGTVIPTVTWSATVPDVPKGHFLWTRTTISYTDATTSAFYSVAYQGQDVDVAVTGLPKSRPSLNLDFANSRYVDPRITFTRASTASYWDDKGILRQALAGQPRIDHDPATGECKGLLIEESRTNLLTYSNDIANAAWIKTNSVVYEKSSVSPDGLMNASLHVTNIAQTGETLTRGVTPTISPGTVFTLSGFFKSAGVPCISLGATQSNNGFIAYFNLITGAPQGNPTVVGTGTVVSHGAKAIGNGWVYVWVSGTIGASGTSAQYRLVHRNTDMSGFVGDGISGVHIWGTQLEVGSFPTSHIPTPAVFTSRASIGTYTDSTGVLRTAAINEVRYDHGLVDGVWIPKGLLLEPQRTNLLTYSDNLTHPSWAKSHVTLVDSQALFPNLGVPVFKMVESAISGVHYFDSINNVAGDNKDYMFSIYAKAAEKYLLSIYFIDPNGIIAASNVGVSLTTGELSGQGTPNTKVSMLSDGWMRISLKARPAAGLVKVRMLFGSTTYLGDGVSGVYVAAPQLEEIPAGQSPEPTSYIKTEATAVTRSADVSTSSAVTRAADSAAMTGENFRSWYNPTEGTLYADVVYTGTNATLGHSPICQLAETTSGSTNFIDLRLQSFRPAAFVQTETNQVTSLSATAATVGENLKMVGGYKINDVAFSVNGDTPILDSSANLPGGKVKRLTITYANTNFFTGHYKKLAYYPKRLPNEQIQALTAE